MFILQIFIKNVLVASCLILYERKVTETALDWFKPDTFVVCLSAIKCLTKVKITREMHREQHFFEVK